MDQLYIVMPAYNEEANIASVVASWYPLLEGKDELSRLVVADAGSTDRTHEILLSLQKRFPKLEVLHTTYKEHGPKLLALYGHAVEQGADFIFQTDSDGQTSPAEFAKFWEMRDDFDGIFGNRTAREDGAPRVFVERVVCRLLRLYFDVKVPDANAPFRLMRAACVAKYLPQFSDDYNLPNIMLTTFFVRGDERVKFVPISFKPRQSGKNSVNIKKIIGIGTKALRDFRKFR